MSLCVCQVNHRVGMSNGGSHISFFQDNAGWHLDSHVVVAGKAIGNDDRTPHGAFGKTVSRRCLQGEVSNKPGAISMVSQCSSIADEGPSTTSFDFFDYGGDQFGTQAPRPVPLAKVYLYGNAVTFFNAFIELGF